MNTVAIMLAGAWRIMFLTAAAPVLGSVLLLAIARLTGDRWSGIDAPARFAPALVAGGALLGVAQIGVEAPVHLRVWMSWWGVGLRATIAGAALAYAGARLRTGAGAAANATFAAVTLALFAALVTPIASDWMLGQVPGHPVSAIGMMLTAEAIAAAAALMLATGRAAPATRADMARLMIAGALGLGYLAFMDYLIVWFGNLPSRVGFYLDRGTPMMVALVWAALLAGLAAPVAFLSLIGGDRGARLAGGAVLLGLLLFNGWWVAGGLAALLLGALLLALLGLGAAMLWRREAAHG